MVASKEVRHEEGESGSAAGRTHRDGHTLPPDAASKLLQRLQIVSVMHEEVIQPLPNLLVHRCCPPADAKCTCCALLPAAACERIHLRMWCRLHDE